MREANLQLKLDRLATEQSLFKKQNELEVVKSTFPLVTQDIFKLKSEVSKLENGIKSIVKLEEELGLRDEDLVKTAF